MSSSLTSDRLEPSDRDMQCLVESVIERIRTVSQRFYNQWRTQIDTTKITGDLNRLNAVFERYEKKDFRHTASEKIAVRTLAQWTVDQNCALVGQPTKKIEWKD